VLVAPEGQVHERDAFMNGEKVTIGALTLEQILGRIEHSRRLAELSLAHVARATGEAQEAISSLKTLEAEVDLQLRDSRAGAK
jgi:hypothetical protein